jgi:predicted AAA+ superfamily ATPase
MSQINVVILQKLKKYPEDVAKLAIEAVRKAESLPEQDVEEQLGSMARRLVKKRRGER